MELDYADYIGYAQNAIKNETIRQAVDQVETLGQFKKNAGDFWEPAAYAGYTMITPTFGDDAANRDSLNKLLMVKRELSDTINPSKIVEAPNTALHMTLARLVSGETFEKNRLSIRENEFFNVFTQLFNTLHIAGLMKFEIKGLVVFRQGVVAAVVSPAGEDDYKSLQLFRDSVYSNEELIRFGVERRRGFHGHISLFYIEEELSGGEKDVLAGAITEANRTCFSKPLPYTVAYAQIRKFDNFLRFYRGDNWPVYRFE